jgi:hypothetical protein
VAGTEEANEAGGGECVRVQYEAQEESRSVQLRVCTNSPCASSARPCLGAVRSIAANSPNTVASVAPGFLCVGFTLRLPSAVQPDSNCACPVVRINTRSVNILQFAHLYQCITTHPPHPPPGLMPCLWMSNFN